MGPGKMAQKVEKRIVFEDLVNEKEMKMSKNCISSKKGHCGQCENCCSVKESPEWYKIKKEKE